MKKAKAQAAAASASDIGRFELEEGEIPPFTVPYTLPGREVGEIASIRMIPLPMDSASSSGERKSHKKTSERVGKRRELTFFKTDENAKIPQKQTNKSIGYDIYSSKERKIKPQQIVRVPTGLCVEFPKHYHGKIYSRSGLAAQKTIVVATGVSIIDPDFRNEITVPMLNRSDTSFVVKKGLRFAQMVIVKDAPNIKVKEGNLEKFQNLAESEREGGFGSTGKY